MPDLDEFTRAYIRGMLFTTNDESTEDGGEPLDRNYDENDLDPTFLASIIADCKAFQDDNAADLERAEQAEEEGVWSPGRDCTVLERAGLDFWMTRAGHGCGFWDGDWDIDGSDEIATRLDAYCDKMGEVYVQVYEGVIYE